MPKSTPSRREVRLFRNGRNQAVRIPVEFELPGTIALMSEEAGRLILEPAPKPGLLAALAGLKPIDEDFPDFDEELLANRTVNL